MPDTLGHAVGAERFELLARLAGNEVRFAGGICIFVTQAHYIRTQHGL